MSEYVADLGFRCGSTAEQTTPLNLQVFSSWPSKPSAETIASCEYINLIGAGDVDFERALDGYFQSGIGSIGGERIGWGSTTSAYAGVGREDLRSMMPELSADLYVGSRPTSRVALHTTRTLPVMDATISVAGLGAATLSELMDIVPLPADRLAPILGVSRRSLYNWSRGREPSAVHEARIQRLRDVLQPLASEWHPSRIAQWFQEDVQAPAVLAERERWDALAAVVRQAKLVRSIGTEPTVDSSADQATSYAASVRKAAFAALAATPELPARRPDWEPREWTGVSVEPDEDM